MASESGLLLPMQSHSGEWEVEVCVGETRLVHERRTDSQSSDLKVARSNRAGRTT